MSDQLTDSTSQPSTRESRSAWLVPAVQALIIVAVAAGLGALGGWWWQRWWTPAQGLVWEGRWNKGLLFLNPKTFAQRWSENAHQDVFAAIAIYLVIAMIAGAVVGLLAALLLARREIVTVCAVIVGGVLGGVIMRAVGTSLGPTDPNALARHTANGVLLPDSLRLVGVTWHPHLWGWHPAADLLVLAFPGAALLVLCVVFLAFDRSPRTTT